MKTSDRSLARLDRLLAVVESGAFYDIAQSIRQANREVKSGRGGRPGEFPLEIHVLYLGFVGAIGSAREVAAEVACYPNWHAIHKALKKSLGEEFASRVNPDHGPTRNQWLYNYRTYLVPNVDIVIEAFKETAAKLAKEVGLLPAKPSLAEPQRCSLIAADGTVVTSPLTGRTIRNKAGEPVGVKEDTGAGWHHEGGETSEEPVYGTKFVTLSARFDETRHGRVILDTRHQPPGRGYGGEAGIAVTAITELKQRVKTLLGVTYDGALRGVHRNTLMKHGLVVVSPQTKGHHPQPIRVHRCECGGTHDMWVRHGALVERTVSVAGKALLTPLHVTKRACRGSGAKHRWYITVRFPDCGFTTMERIDNVPSDADRGFNRAEHLRQFAEGSDTYTRLHGYRQDAESVHSTLDRRLPFKRMIAYTSDRQRLIMIGFAMSENALASKYAPRVI